MTVPVNKRKESKLKVSIATETLLRHTADCVSNKNKFPDAFYDIITKDIVSLAKAIHLKCKHANDIRVTNVTNKNERIRLQEEAIKHCDEFYKGLWEEQ
jgi:hypothetical protein